VTLLPDTITCSACGKRVYFAEDYVIWKHEGADVIVCKDCEQERIMFTQMHYD
jgi:hypothetical protein